MYGCDRVKQVVERLCVSVLTARAVVGGNGEIGQVR
jgi:hypothetical protein